MRQSCKLLSRSVLLNYFFKPQLHAQCWYSLFTLFKRIDVHVCTDDIDSLHSAMQISIGKVYMGKDMDR